MPDRGKEIDMNNKMKRFAWMLLVIYFFMPSTGFANELGKEADSPNPSGWKPGSILAGFELYV